MHPLEYYQVSLRTGFLPEEPPLKRLPSYFDEWESAVEDLPALQLATRVRKVVDAMPILNATRLSGEPEWRRAYSVLGFLAHAYVWQRPEPESHLPRQITDPLLIVSQHLELPPIATYAGLVLWNWRRLPGTEALDLQSLATISTYTGGLDESWFYLVSVAIEAQGGTCLAAGLEAMHSSNRGDVFATIKALQRFAEGIDGLSSILMRFYELCDPHVFYFRLRPFLAGWKNMAGAGLPDGVWYGEERHARLYAGGSNAQSSLIQAFDILLSVEHHATGERKPPRMSSSRPQSAPMSVGKGNVFLYEMRKYMPSRHRMFLEDLEAEVDIRGFVVENASEYPEIVLSYDACLACLRAFRSKHIQIVTRYISLPARKAQESGVANTSTGIARTSGDVGTGGTSLLPFLKQARDETGDVAAGDWGHRLLTVIPPRVSNDFTEKSP